MATKPFVVATLGAALFLPLLTAAPAHAETCVTDGTVIGVLLGGSACTATDPLVTALPVPDPVGGRPRWADPAPMAEPLPEPPVPVDPAPVDPAPVDSTPLPVDPAPVPVDPAPVDPTPVDPVPLDPAPVPVDPAPVPVDPAPVPVDPVTGPGPVDPDPVANPVPVPVPVHVPLPGPAVPVSPAGRPVPARPAPVPPVQQAPPGPTASAPGREATPALSPIRVVSTSELAQLSAFGTPTLPPLEEGPTHLVAEVRSTQDRAPAASVLIPVPKPRTADAAPVAVASTAAAAEARDGRGEAGALFVACLLGGSYLIFRDVRERARSRR
jgi:hypothetical protein